VLVVDVVGEPAYRALRARRRVAVGRRRTRQDDVRAVGVLLAAERIGRVLGQVGRGLVGPLTPGVGRVRADELGGQVMPAVEALPLQGGGEAVALAVEFLGAE